MEKRYRALRTIGTIYKILGGIVGIITILLALGICITSVFGSASLSNITRQYGGSGAYGIFGGLLGGIIGGFLTILSGFAMAISLYAAGEGVYLLLAIEENTRAAATSLPQPANHST